MNKYKYIIIIAISAIVSLFGIIGMLGWIFDIVIFRNILPTWTPIKFTAALSLFWSGFILYFTARSLKGESNIEGAVFIVPIFIIFLLMITQLVSMIFGFRPSFEELLVQISSGQKASGRPPIATMIGFNLIALAGLLTIFNISNIKILLRWIGIIVGVIGAVALFGYAFNIPILYHHFGTSGLGSAMAFHIALPFALIGLGFYLLGRNATQGKS